MVSPWCSSVVFLTSAVYFTLIACLPEWSAAWMFGVAVWELYTGCSRTPYNEIELQSEIMVDLNLGALRLQLPVSCPAPIRAVIEACWKLKPDERPTMQTVVQELRSIVARMEQDFGISSRSTS